METERAKRLAGFVSWVGANIKGDEKGEAQVFLDRFFQAFGHAGLKEAGATLEERIKKSDGKGTAFADLVWKPVVLIEMKKRGSGLACPSRSNKPSSIIASRPDLPEALKAGIVAMVKAARS